MQNDEFVDPQAFEMDLLSDGTVRLTFKDNEGMVLGPRINLTPKVALQISQLLDPASRQGAIDDARSSLRRH